MPLVGSLAGAGRGRRVDDRSSQRRHRRVLADGQTLIYLDAPGGGDCNGWGSSLWLVDADRSDPRLLVDRGGQFVRWSPDGKRIALSSGWAVHVIDVATGKSTHVADGIVADWLDDTSSSARNQCKAVFSVIFVLLVKGPVQKGMNMLRARAEAAAAA